MTANIPMGGFKFTGLSAGTTNGDSVRYEQIIGAFLPITGGTLTGNLLFTDATYDIGASGATRPRDLFLSRNAVIGGTINVTGHTTFEGVTSTGATGTGKLVYDGSPTLTTAVLGSSTATTQAASDNSTKVATTAYADAAIGTKGAFAYAYFNGTSVSPITPLKALNVTNITKSATGVYVVNLTSALGSANSVVIPHAADSGAPQTVNICHVSALATGGPTIKTYNSGNTATDYDTMMVVIYGS